MEFILSFPGNIIFTNILFISFKFLELNYRLCNYSIVENIDAMKRHCKSNRHLKMDGGKSTKKGMCTNFFLFIAGRERLTDQGRAI